MPIWMSGSLKLEKCWRWKERHTTRWTSLLYRVNKSGLVGHVPFNLTPIFSHFLKRSFNKGIAKITGEKVNRGGGYGLEVPCMYDLYGSKAYVERAKAMLIGDLS